MPTATPPPISPSPAPAVRASTFGALERTRIVVANPLANLNQQAPLWIAKDKGYQAEAGFTSVDIVTRDAREALLSGHIDIGVVGTLDVADAASKGIPLRIIAGNTNYSSVLIAVHKSIGSVKDLDGRDILLAAAAGSRDVVDRSDYLKAAGWDISTVKPNLIYDARGSDAWVPLLMEGKIFLTPIFNRHKDAVLAAGHRLVVDTLQYGSSSFATTLATLEQAPNAVAAFLWAHIKALQVWRDVANRDYVLTRIAPMMGVAVNPGIRDAYEYDVRNFRPFDGGWDHAELVAWLGRNFGTKAPDPKTFVTVGPLNRAQAVLSLPVNPKL